MYNKNRFVFLLTFFKIKIVTVKPLGGKNNVKLGKNASKLPQNILKNYLPTNQARQLIL